MDFCDALRVAVATAERALQADVGDQCGRIELDHRVLFVDQRERGGKLRCARP